MNPVRRLVDRPQHVDGRPEVRRTICVRYDWFGERCRVMQFTAIRRSIFWDEPWRTRCWMSCQSARLHLHYTTLALQSIADLMPLASMIDFEAVWSIAAFRPMTLTFATCRSYTSELIFPTRMTSSFILIMVVPPVFSMVHFALRAPVSEIRLHAKLVLETVSTCKRFCNCFK